MSFIKVVLSASLLTSLLNLVHCKEKVNCQKFRFVIDEDVVHNHILEGHVFKRLTVKSAAQCHVRCKDDCLCVSMNYFSTASVNNCELNDVNKDMMPAAMKRKPGVNYYDLVRSYTVKDGKEYIPGKHRCVNKCCHCNPCMNVGVCKEICDISSVRFNCICPATYTGQRCEKIKYLKSCTEIVENSGNLTSGKYVIYGSANVTFPVYCDMESEPGFVWTLIQSFSLANKATFEEKGFGTDFPQNTGDNSEVDWTVFRLSLSHMQSLATHSTHLRATCNFPSKGLVQTDYARAKLEGHNFFGSRNYLCREYEYINIRNISCYDCTAATKQKPAWTINSVKSKTRYGCDLDGTPGITDIEHNFGLYGNRKVNAAHRCSSSPASTTQHWLGATYDL